MSPKKNPSPIKPSPIRRCPACQSPCQPNQTSCLICQHEMAPDVFTAELVLEEAECVPEEAELVPEETVPRGGNSYSLTTMFIVVAVYAVCFTVWRLEPGSGIAMVIITTSALVATAVRGRRHLRRGDKFGKADKIGTFYISFLASIGLWCAAIVVLVIVVWIVLVVLNLWL